jgi:nickel/cobalt transporter (NicO) family protein
MFHWLVDVQHWLYGGMWRELKATTDLASLPAFMAAAFVFGMVHALMPGHGKSVLVSYHLGRPSRLLEGITTGTILALTHVGLAVVLVLAGVMVISRAFAQGGRAPAFDTMSAMFIVLIGAFLVYKALRPHTHGHHHDGRALALVTGMVPCPLTTFILTYALAQHKLAIGLAAVVAMLLGVMVTLVGFAVAAVLARDRFMIALRRSEQWREGLGYWVELAGAIAVFVLGLSMLWTALHPAGT